MNKTIISTIALSLVVCFASAQKVKEAEVPAAVKDAFAKKYPGVKVEKWEKEDGNFEAEYDQGKDDMAAVFDASGTFMQSEVEIKTATLPKAISDYVTQTYAGAKVAEGTKILTADGKTLYECEIKKGKDKFDLLFDDKGVFIKKTEESAKSDEDDDDREDDK